LTNVLFRYIYPECIVKESSVFFFLIITVMTPIVK